MQALLIKSDLWDYASGASEKPFAGENNANAAAVNTWVKNDLKAKSDIILSISSSELKQVKNRVTSRDMWLRLEEIYQSKGPARKATLLKSLILWKMADSGDVREHPNEFFDSVDKLNDMDAAINPDFLLTILLLYSLPASFDVFRCAIESRDDLPTQEALRIKVIEESDARRVSSRGSSARSDASCAMMANNVKTPQYFDASNAVNPVTRQLSVATRIIEVATRSARTTYVCRCARPHVIGVWTAVRRRTCAMISDCFAKSTVCTAVS